MQSVRSALWALKGTSGDVFEAEFGDALHGLEVATLRHAVETVLSKVEAREAEAMKKFGYIDADLRVYLEGARYAVDLMTREIRMFPETPELVEMAEAGGNI